MMGEGSNCPGCGEHMAESEFMGGGKRRKNCSGCRRRDREYKRVLLEARVDPSLRVARAAFSNDAKAVARRAVDSAVQSGKLVRQDTCSECKEKSHTAIEMHHWSYSEEHWLDVVHLCRKCHVNEHKRIVRGCSLYAGRGKIATGVDTTPEKVQS